MLGLDPEDGEVRLGRKHKKSAPKWCAFLELAPAGLEPATKRL